MNVGYFEYKCRRCGKVFLGASLEINEAVHTGTAAREFSALEGEVARLMSDLTQKGVTKHPNGGEIHVLDNHCCEDSHGALGVGDLIGFGYDTKKK
jgi:hypothetical protein